MHAIYVYRHSDVIPQANDMHSAIGHFNLEYQHLYRSIPSEWQYNLHISDLVLYARKHRTKNSITVWMDGILI